MESFVAAIAAVSLGEGMLALAAIFSVALLLRFLVRSLQERRV